MSRGLSNFNKAFLSLLEKRLEDLTSGRKAKLVKELKFFSERKWRFDYAFVENEKIILAIEIEGCLYSEGRHRSSTGFLNDIEKYNKATELGIPLLRYTYGNNICDIVEQVKTVLSNEEQRKSN